MDDAQAQRDHLSHLLYSLSTLEVDKLLCFDGTVLARTRLSDDRLSQDIDLSTPDRMTSAKTLHDALPRALRREFPSLDRQVPLTLVRGTDPALLGTGNGIWVHIQRSAEHIFKLSAKTRSIKVRYADVPSACRHCPLSPR